MDTARCVCCFVLFCVFLCVRPRRHRPLGVLFCVFLCFVCVFCLLCYCLCFRVCLFLLLLLVVLSVLVLSGGSAYRRSR